MKSEQPTSASTRLIHELVEKHESWRRRCLNLCAAENAMSPAVLGMLRSDLAQRYGDYQGRDLDARKYFGTRCIVEIEKTVESLAREVFQADAVELRPVSGHTAGNAVMMGLCRPGDTVMELSREGGGHRLASKLVTSPLIPLQVEYLPFNAESFNLDVDATVRRVAEIRPRLIFVGSSNFLFPAPLRELAAALKAYPETIIVYDASHVLGLIAGGRFQNPLAEGAHLVLAGTQKSFPGPQGGVIYSNDHQLMAQISEAVYPALLSNHHLARLPALGLALAEAQVGGAAYADAVIANARALATALHQEGLAVVGNGSGFTDSHTVLISIRGLAEGVDWGRSLDDQDIIANTMALPPALGKAGIRFGVSEITRLGATPAVMTPIASLIADVLLQRADPATIRSRVHRLTAEFQPLS